MSFLKKHRMKIFSVILIALILGFSYMRGGNIPQKMEKEEKILAQEVYQEEKAFEAPKTNQPEKTEETQIPKAQEESQGKAENTENQTIEATVQKAADYSAQQGMIIDKETGMDKYNTTPVPMGKPVPIEPQTVTISDKELTCTLSVRCDTLISNIEWLDKEKVELVPYDGVIFAECEVVFYEGESVFNLLLREMKKNKIHMEYVNTPIYNSAYIEGINNLYEFDCGELSGWMYKVNGWFPNYGCSRYQLKQGDRVEWVYTCDLGRDVGENFNW